MNPQACRGRPCTVWSSRRGLWTRDTVTSWPGPMTTTGPATRGPAPPGEPPPAPAVPVVPGGRTQAGDWRPSCPRSWLGFTVALCSQLCLDTLVILLRGPGCRKRPRALQSTAGTGGGGERALSCLWDLRTESPLGVVLWELIFHSLRPRTPPWPSPLQGLPPAMP